MFAVLMPLPHLRDVPSSALPARLREVGIDRPETLARRLDLAIHGSGALDWADLGLGRRCGPVLRAAFRFGPQLVPVGVRASEDGTRKFAYALASGEVIEAVLIRNRENRTLCV